MLEDQVANLLQRYLGNYVRGLNKEALKISVWRGDVELTNMQLKPEALNALKLPVKVKAGFLGSVKLKVPWSRLGQEPVLVYLDRIFLLAEPATHVEGCSEDAVQEAKKSKVRETEMKLLERAQQLKSEMNKSWLGSLIDTIVGNLKLSISNIHIRYEDLESNPDHPFAMGLTLEKLIAVTIDDNGKETFVTGGALDRIQKSVELEQIALYLDSGISPWHLDEPWEDLLPAEWAQVFRFGTDGGKPANRLAEKHTYILQPVTGNAKYVKLRPNEYANDHQPRQRAAVNLDDVTLCLSKNGYRDVLKLADNFASFSQRLKYAHFRPPVAVKASPSLWWKYAYRAISDQMKKSSGKLSWDQVLKYARLRKRYISLYAQLLKSDPSRVIIDDSKDIEELDRELDIELILQWRMLAHKFVDQSAEADAFSKKQRGKKSWWSFGRSRPSIRDESETFHFSEEDWEQLNRMIGYKEEDGGQTMIIDERKDALHTLVEIQMKHNASKLIDESRECLAALSCESLGCSVKLYPETKVFDLKLGSYQLSSPNGLLAESATPRDSLVGVFCYKPFDAKVDWSLVAKASPCYVTYLKDSIDQVVKFFESDSGLSPQIALETAAALQMTIDEVKRTAQQQMNRALRDQSRFSLDLDIAAPKITIPTDFKPDDVHSTKLLLDLGNLMIRAQDDQAEQSTEEMDTFLRFNLVLSDVSAFLVDGDYFWHQTTSRSSKHTGSDGCTFFPVIDRCGIMLSLEQNRLENPSYPSTRIAMRLPSLGFHFSPARYHRLMRVFKIFQNEDGDSSYSLRPWSQADLEGWLFLLVWKGMANREAVWQRRYLCLVGPFLYVLDRPSSRSYKQCISLRGKQVCHVPAELVGNADNVLAICEAARSNSKVVEDVNALIVRCDNIESRKLWQTRIQGAIYHASGSAAIANLSESSSDLDDSVKGDNENQDTSLEKVFVTGLLDELKICFYCNLQHGQSFMRVLMAEENRLFEFRAIGGQVELLVRENEMLVGTLLRSLEIEDLLLNDSISRRQYLVRSFIGSVDTCSCPDDIQSRGLNGDERTGSEGDEKFYEAPESLADSVDSPMQSSLSFSENQGSEFSSKSQNLSLEPPGFDRVPGLLPYYTLETTGRDSELIDTLNSFVKAQIIVHDQSSPLYNNIDKQVTVTLATVSFYCRRPTILAIMEFVSAINTEEEHCESFSGNPSMAIASHDNHRDGIGDDQRTEAVAEEPVVKGLLGKGKSRIVFNLMLNMARAQILLMNEREAKVATLLQDNLVTDIKVFPSSFLIKAALGNLRISDDSLPSNHMYFWICDMRNPGGSSFVELLFSSFNVDDEDYEGYDYALSGELSEVRIVYLNRFVEEVVSYFMGLVPSSSKSVVKIKDQVTDSEKWFSTSEIEGSPAVKLDLSLRKPIILMPRRTDSIDYLKLDIVHITVQNNFQWLFGSRKEINAVHVDILTILVKDINLNVGIGAELGESIIQDVKGVSVVIRRSLRDILHQVPSSEISIKIGEIKAALSSREYQIITECAKDNFSETPNLAPTLNDSVVSSAEVDASLPQVSEVESASTSEESWTTTKVSVVINLVVLCLHTGVGGDTSLATVQVSGVWVLYKSNKLGDGFLSASLDGFTVIDDREGTEEGLRLAVGKSEDVSSSSLRSAINNKNGSIDHAEKLKDDIKLVPTMLILDAKFSQSSTVMSLCVQRPQLLVALDFLLAVVEFFVPSAGDLLSHEDGERSMPFNVIEAITLDQSVYRQPSAEITLSPQRPLIVDDERYNHFIYDGQGGTLYLKDGQGLFLSAPSKEIIIYVGNGKKLQLKNVIIKDGRYLDSCIFLGANSSYTASKDDHVYLEELDQTSCTPLLKEGVNRVLSQHSAVARATGLIIELQAIGPELTFYSTSKDVGQSQSLILSNKLLHAQLDAFCRLVLKDDTIEMSANALGLTMESNGIRILEPFDTTVNYSNVSGKTNINICFSDIFMNLSFSILRLFLAVEEDVLTFLRRSSKKMTVVCTQFDEVGTIRDPQNDQVYVFWKPRAPPGFAVLGDYLTPTEKPPTKGVTAINTNFLRVKKPVSFRLVWSTLDAGVGSEQCKNNNGSSPSGILNEDGGGCSVWFPEAPKGYVALGCVVSQGRKQPQLSSVSCILTSLVTPCSLRDCITIRPGNQFSSTVAFWRVGNSAGTFLPADGSTSFLNVAYELRHIMLPFLDSSKASESASIQASSSYINAPEGPQPERSVVASSGRRFEAVANFQLVWWNQGSNSRRRLSIWRPVVPQGTVYFGDIAVQGYEPPSTCIVLHDTGGEEHFKAPSDFQLVGQIKKQKGMESISFWMPQAPPGFVSLGSVACKNVPKQNEFSALRCIRSDMVCGDQFLEESLWDTSDTKIKGDAFSIWTVGNDLGTFIVRSGFKKPSRRFALKLADPGSPSGADDTVIDVEVKTFSAALFDDYGGLMVPLCNVSLSGLGFSLHGRQDRINSTASFSLDVRSYNDKYDAWEPLVEPVDGFLRYQYDLNAPGAASQLRFISRRALNLNVSVSNANMIVQAYASWSSLSHVHESNKQHYEKTVSSTCGGGSVIGVHHKRDYYIIPRNKLGQDIFIRATEIRGLSNIIRMPSGDMKPLRVPVMKNMLDSHMKGKLFGKVRAMVTVLVADAEITRVEGSTSGQYAGVVRLVKEESVPSESMLNQLSARTRGLGLDHSSSSEHGMVNWSEMFFFKVDDPGRYVLELIVIDMGKGDSVGFFSAPLEQVAEKNVDFLSPSSYLDKLSWMDLSCALPKNSAEGENAQKCGRIRGAIFVAPRYELQNGELLSVAGKRPGFVQISPSREGPWTTVRLNYAAPAACWRLDNDVVASEVIVKDGDRYVDIRSLVTVKNNTDTTLDLCLKSRRSDDEMASEGGRIEVEHDKTEVDEFFETEEYSPINGWTSSSYQDNSVSGLPSGWEWIDNWQLDKTSVNTGDGWVYAPDIESLKWPESYDSLKSVNYARRRRWIRSRRPIPSYLKREISLGQLSPGDTVPLPLSSLIESEHFVLHLRPFSSQGSDEYSWSSVVDKLEDSGKQKGNSKICVSALAESDELLYCTQLNGTSLSGSQKLWFCVSIQATELAKDVRSDPIQDWSIVIKSPMSLSNFLPLAAEFTVLELRADGHFTVCARGILCPGMPVNVYSADIRNPLFFSLLPQKGWSPVHETVILSHPRGVPSKTMSLRSAFTGRIVQIIIEQNYDREQPMLAKAIRIYAPYWVAVARCPPLKLRFIDRGGEKFTRKIALPFHFKKSDELIFEEIAEEEIYDGYTIASALNSNLLGLSASLSGEERFGTVKDLSLLGDMDGSLDIDAYDADGKCVKLFISTKPCPYQSIPTKVICIRPFLTFTNRLGQDILLKLSSEDDAKVLRACDYRVSFSYQEDNRPYNLQVRLDDTEWSYPIHITKEDTISLVLRTQNGSRKFVRTEIRGYEEGSRFIVVFRLGSASGPIRMENRITGKRICIRQTGFNDKYWINLEPFSTTNFSWEDPYGQKFIEAKIDDGNISEIWKFDLEETGFQSVEQGELKIKFYAFEIGDIKVARFTNGTSSDLHVETRLLTSMGTQQSNHLQTNAQSGMGPLELVVELGVVGVSLVDHKPKELSYLYFERVFMSYSTGYDGGTTTRFKLILGYLQLDNQLPLTLMPVLLAPEQATDIHHPVFKMTIAVCNENPDGVLVYPYVYIRVTDKVWRLNIHEPIIWALVDLYSNIQLDRLPQTSSVTQVDPEIRVNLVDISEVRLKVSLETAPAQRPRGVLGVWSPILSAVGKAFKIQIHLRRVMRKDRFMRKSSILPAVGNRIMRDLIHNPLHLLFSVDVLGMASSTLASLSRGFAELSTDGQFLQLRSKQVRSRRITGVGDGILQGTGALAQGVAFGVSGVVKKPVESAKQSGILGLAHGVGRAFVGFVVQPVSGALDFFSMTVDGIGASCSKFLEVLNKSSLERIRNPRAIHADGILRDYCEREALGQMILYLAEASRHFGCTEIFKEPSKFAWSDYYEEHFFVPYQRILLVTNKRVMLLQCLDLDNLDKRPCKIMWDVPWQELMALELAKAGSSQPSHLILHLKKFRRSENFVRVIKCVTEEESGRVPQAVTICSVVRKMWKAYQSDTKSLVLKVPSSQRHVYFAWSEADGRGTRNLKKAIVRSRDFSSSSSASEERRFVKHTISFRKIWSSERETKGHCTLCQKKISDTAGLCSIWRPTCPDGYVSVGDIARVGNHPPNCAAVYQNIEQHFALPIGYDLVWRNCLDDYTAPVSIWQPRAPEGFVSLGCVAVSSFTEPEPDLVYCVAESLAEQTEFEEQKIWSDPDSYPWACHIYQIQSDALHFVALRQTKGESDWKPMRVRDEPLSTSNSLKTH